jgi:hypothetical protein
MCKIDLLLTKRFEHYDFIFTKALILYHKQTCLGVIVTFIVPKGARLCLSPTAVANGPTVHPLNVT